MTPYENLVAVLDALRAEAPARYVSYHPSVSDAEKLNAARSKAFLHLFLKARFGLLSFEEREAHITEGTDDGGIDAYFIDVDRKVIHFLQAKFRATERNFEEKSIDAEELLMMDIARILDGETRSVSGRDYNQKILNMAKTIGGISDIGRYGYAVSILANVKGVTRQKLATLTGGLPAEIFDYKTCYAKLLFPLVSGTYYHADELQLSLSLSDKSAGAKISYTVATELTKCEITVVFVPTIEIAKAMFKYRNSILQYNPRSYLGHEGKAVNMEIRRSIENRATNEFALFNNGITILSDETYLNERIGQRERAQLILVNPQIINGGQTAYTLSVIYREHMAEDVDALFGHKEVLVKIITFEAGNKLQEGSKLALIEEISRATNQQTTVTTADRRSNELSVKELQRKLFDETGLFFERKRGEFEDGLREGYISDSQIIDRTLFFRAALVALGRLRQAHQRKLAAKMGYSQLVQVSNEMFKKYAFAILLLSKLVQGPKRQERVTGLLLAKLYFGVAIAFRPNVSIHERDAAVDAVARTLNHRWSQFQEFAITRWRTRGSSKGSRQLEQKFTGYLNGPEFVNDVRRFVSQQDDADGGLTPARS